MGKLKSDEQGFSAVEVILVLVIVVLVGAVGFLVYKNQHKTKVAPVAATTATTKPTTTKTTTPVPTDPYAGWTTFTGTGEGVTFKYPSTWTTKGTSTIYSAQASSVPYFFKISYAAPSASDGVIDGDNGTETILSVTPLTVHSSTVPLYLVAFNAPGSSSPSDVFEFALTDQSYTVGQTVDHVKVAASQKTSGDHYYLTANLVTAQDQQYLGEYTLAQYQAQPDYANMVKMFQSLSY